MKFYSVYACKHVTLNTSGNAGANFIREKDLELKRFLNKKNTHAEIIYFVTLSIRVTVKTRCCLWGETEREG